MSCRARCCQCLSLPAGNSSRHHSAPGGGSRLRSVSTSSACQHDVAPCPAALIPLAAALLVLAAALVAHRRRMACFHGHGGKGSKLAAQNGTPAPPASIRQDPLLSYLQASVPRPDGAGNAPWLRSASGAAFAASATPAPPQGMAAVEPWEINFDDLIFQRALGQGSFGKGEVAGRFLGRRRCRHAAAALARAGCCFCCLAGLRRSLCPCPVLAESLQCTRRSTTRLMWQ